MPIEYLIILSYGAASIFLMTLVLGIGIVAMLRRIRLQATIAVSNSQIAHRRLHQITRSVADVSTWNSKQASSPIKNTATSSQIHLDPTKLPLRYQQTRLYANKSTDAQNDIETKPEFPSVEPAMP